MNSIISRLDYVSMMIRWLNVGLSELREITNLAPFDSFEEGHITHKEMSELKAALKNDLWGNCCIGPVKWVLPALPNDFPRESQGYLLVVGLNERIKCINEFAEQLVPSAGLQFPESNMALDLNSILLR